MNHLSLCINFYWTGKLGIFFRCILELILFLLFIALFQPVALGSREFDDIVKILHSSYLEPSSVSNFNYRRASLVHSELLEKEVSIFVAFLYE